MYPYLSGVEAERAASQGCPCLNWTVQKPELTPEKITPYFSRKDYQKIKKDLKHEHLQVEYIFNSIAFVTVGERFIILGQLGQKRAI